MPELREEQVRYEQTYYGNVPTITGSYLIREPFRVGNDLSPSGLWPGLA
jgi:hypothetical protein